MTDAGRSFRQFRDTLARTPVVATPFAHSFSEQVFPDEYYGEIRAMLPPTSVYRVAPSELGNGSDRPARHDLWLHDAFLTKLAPPLETFWRDFAREATCGATAEAALAPYQPFLAADAAERYEIKIRLVRESGPYHLTPHLDLEQKRLVLIVYLAEAGAPETLGTTLYRRTGPTQFAPVAALPYRANCASAMLRTPDAWHGGEWPNLAGERNTIHFYFLGEP